MTPQATSASRPQTVVPVASDGFVARIPVPVPRGVMLMLNLMTIACLLLAMWALLAPGGMLSGE